MKDHYARVQILWIHGACHWTEEDPWIYYHNFSRSNELVNIIVEWLENQCEAASRISPPTIAEVNISVHDKGKRNIVNNEEVEQRYKFIVDPLV